MSYLNIKDSIPNFKKAVISFWFRVPKESFKKLKEVTDKESAGSTPPPPLSGILPLVTFGKIYDGHNYHLQPNETGGSYTRHAWVHGCTGWLKIGDEGPIEYSTGSSIVQDTETIHADPSYIGILYIQGDEGSGGGSGGSGGSGSGSSGNGGSGAPPVAMVRDGATRATELPPIDVSPGPGDPGSGGGNGSGSGGGGTPDKYLLAMRLQTASYGEPIMMRTKNSFYHSDENWGYAVFVEECPGAEVESHCRGGVGCVEDTVAPDNPTVDMTTAEDISSEVFKKGVLLPDFFQVAVTTEITPDAWHHVLVSFNLDHETSATGTFVSGDSTSCDCTNTTNVTDPTFKDPCKIFIALDDINCDDKKLTRGFNLGFEDTVDTIPKSLGKNDWLSNFTLQAYYGGGSTNHSIAWSVTGQVIDTTRGGASAPSYTFSGDDAAVASEKGPFGIPAGSNVADRILEVSMAEFLIFTDYFGDTFDLSIEKNRRHFITGPDSKGFQYPTNVSPLFIPMRKFAIGDPFYWEDGADNPAFAPPLFDPSAWPTAIKINGETAIAAIDFTKCQFNWQMGLNLGKSKSKVERTGKVRAYYHDPKVEAPT